MMPPYMPTLTFVVLTQSGCLLSTVIKNSEVKASLIKSEGACYIVILILTGKLKYLGR